MILYPVAEKKNHALRCSMERLGIRESDLEESFVRAGGPGGQNVNKVATCVVLKHVPSGLTVKCQAERSQATNRYRARCILVERLEAQVLGRQSKEARRVAKIKRQKRKRSKRAKEKILYAKRERSEKKRLRKLVDAESS
jgi:protein subunit release factor B